MAVIEESFVRLLDRVENRYLGKYTGFVSDNSDPENRGRSRVAGFEAHLVKPVSPNLVRQTLRRLLAHCRGGTPHV